MAAIIWAITWQQQPQQHRTIESQRTKIWQFSYSKTSVRFAQQAKILFMAGKISFIQYTHWEQSYRLGSLHLVFYFKSTLTISKLCSFDTTFCKTNKLELFSWWCTKLLTTIVTGNPKKISVPCLFSQSNYTPTITTCNCKFYILRSNSSLTMTGKIMTYLF